MNANPKTVANAIRINRGLARQRTRMGIVSPERRRNAANNGYHGPLTRAELANSVR